MKNIVCFIKENYLIIAILLVFSFLKMPLIWQSYPIIYNIDEPYLINSGLRVLYNFFKFGSLDPQFYDWGSFPIYVSAFLNAVLILIKYFFFNENNLSLEVLSYSIQRVDFHVLNRFFSLMLMNISTFIIYYFCKKNFNQFIALLSALIITISPKYISLSTLATVDHWNVFFASLIIYYSFELNKNFYSAKNVIIYGFILGISVATKYSNFLFVVPFLTIFANQILKKKFPIKQSIIFCFSSLFSFLVSMPYSIINFPDFISSLRRISEHYNIGHIGADTNYNNSYFNLIEYFFSTIFINPLINALSIICILFLLTKKNKQLILITYPIIFCLFIGSYKVFFSRNLITILPFVSILSSLLIYEFYIISKKNLYKYFIFLILILVSLPTLKLNLKLIKKSLLTDTRYISLKWIEQNLNPNDQIIATNYSPPVWNLESFQNSKKFWLIDYSKEKYSMNHIDDDTKYIILSSGAYGKYFNKDGSLVKRYQDKGGKIYLNLFKSNELVKSFKADNKKTIGPEIRIYLNKSYTKK